MTKLENTFLQVVLLFYFLIVFHAEIHGQKLMTLAKIYFTLLV